jgi:hypothetical protein
MVKTEGQLYPIPERWLSTPEGQFAHSIKLPAPHDRPRNLYRSGMEAKEYFEALCSEEAGEFVFTSALGVDIVFELRPRREARSEEFFHLFAMEDPYGYVNGETRERIGGTWTAGNAYSAIERRSPNIDAYERVFRRSVQDRQISKESISAPSARYGFVWRGIARPGDREHGIAGGELIAIELQTKKVMGFRRGFAISGVGRRGASWEFSAVCPRQQFRGGRSKDFDFGLWFLSKVLQQSNSEAYQREIAGGAR